MFLIVNKKDGFVFQWLNLYPETTFEVEMAVIFRHLFHRHMQGVRERTLRYINRESSRGNASWINHVKMRG